MPPLLGIPFLERGARGSLRGFAWLWRRKVELCVFLLGVLLRLSMKWNYHPYWSYDSVFHWDVISWILEHRRIPYPEDASMSFHPPLYYLVGAMFVDHGFARETLPWVSISYGILRLALIWAGLEICLPRSRWARVSALALAATVSASVHLDGMVYPEAQSGLLNAAAMLCAMLTFRNTGARRLGLALLTGLLLGLAILTKISATGVIMAVGATAFFEFLFSKRPFGKRVLAALPWGGTLAVCLAVSGWYYAHNVERYGRPFVTSFDLPAQSSKSQSWLLNEFKDQQVIDRRTLGYVFAWSDEPYKWPHYPAALFGHSRFFPVLIASSVVDYWEYGYQGYKKAFRRNPNRPQRTLFEVQDSARLAIAGGTVVFFAAVLAWLASAKRLAEQRDFSRLFLLMVPLAALAGALQWTTAYPVDGYGVVKGIYMTFAAPPLYALFGVAVGWARQNPLRWPVLGLCLFALLLVANYSLVCRLGFPLVIT